MKVKGEGLLVKSFRKSKWTDKNSEEEMIKYYPMHPNFYEKCLKAFGAETYDGPGENFSYQIMTIDN